MKRVLVTGSQGFMGRHLVQRLQGRGDLTVLEFERTDSPAALGEMARRADLVYHLAGVNRPPDEGDFDRVNRGLTLALIRAVEAAPRRIPIVFSSSIQAVLKNPYGISKRRAERALIRYGLRHRVPVYLFRLPNTFGGGARPDYNSVVATFCYRIAHDQPIRIDDPHRTLRLVYIDDVVAAFEKLVDGPPAAGNRFYYAVDPVFAIGLAELAELLRQFKSSLPELADPSRPADALRRHLAETYRYYQSLP
jgi:UDP-2-acetamido-2,6-beta-L-arabino-hexul-4-ose reductase